jgi:hypothetical protein
VRKLTRRIRRLGPEDQFLNGMLLFVALALIVVGVWRMGTEPRAGSTEVRAERVSATVPTSRAATTTTTAKATVPAANPAGSVEPSPTTSPREEREHRSRGARTTTTTRAAPRFGAVPPAQMPAPPSTPATSRPTTPTTRPTPTTTPTTQPTSTTTRPRPGDEIQDPVAP